jgi:uncharacterized damage-inducible protein DinB
METFYQDCLNRFQELHARIEQAIEGLAPEALDWAPGPRFNSFCVLVVHLTGAERYWIGDVIAGDPSGRDRASEFEARGLDGEALQKRLRDTLGYVRSALEELQVEDLERLRISPRNGQEFTVGWALAHTLEHTAIHLGHIQLTRKVWDQQHRRQR